MRHNRQGFIAWFIRQAIDGGVIELYGEGRQRRDMNYVEDVVDALLLAGASEEAEGEVYNLGGDEPVSLAELAEELISHHGPRVCALGALPAGAAVDRRGQHPFELRQDRGGARLAAAHAAARGA
jgi:nucleoside-diphosphate-sugar epimerase